MANPIWKLNSLALPGDGRPRLDRVTATIGVGVTAVVGQSGAGKTSLLNVLVGMEKAVEGAIEFHCPSAASEAPAFSLPVFWAPQDGGLWPHLSAHGHLSSVFDGNSLKSDNLTQDSTHHLDNLLRNQIILSLFN